MIMIIIMIHRGKIWDLERLSDLTKGFMVALGF